MEEPPTVQAYLDLSRSYLRIARSAREHGELEPARFTAIHALELAVKAAILHAEGVLRPTHQVGGAFGRLYRHQVGPSVSSRVNRVLRAYDEPRYPGGAPVQAPRLDADLGFVHFVVEDLVPRLVGEP